jgi:decaprenylphospho-beta-D-erythro-pentofuranosid-2-ulose 2-reductase
MPTVLILGAGSDMAVALARHFGKEKYHVQLAGRNLPALQALQTDLQIRYGITAKSYAFDALDFNSHRSFYDGLDIKPDITICVFGYLGNHQVAQTNWTETSKIIHSNYTGAVSILNIVAEDYAKKRQGTIVGISSVAGERGRQSNYLYGSAKAGFTAYLSGLRNYLFQYGVHVMSVQPSFVYTKMTEDLKLPPLLTATPAQVASAIAKAIQKKKNVLYVKWMWRYIMFIIKSIPEPIFKKLKL